MIRNGCCLTLDKSTLSQVLLALALAIACALRRWRAVVYAVPRQDHAAR